MSAKAHHATVATRSLIFAEFSGEVTSIGQKSLTADGPDCRVGDICRVGDSSSAPLAEVVAVSEEKVQLLPLGVTAGARIGDKVVLATHLAGLRVGDDFAGRAIDAFGAPIDGGPAIAGQSFDWQTPTTSLSKIIVPERVCTGIRALDGLLPLAKVNGSESSPRAESEKQHSLSNCRAGSRATGSCSA